VGEPFIRDAVHVVHVVRHEAVGRASGKQGRWPLPPSRADDDGLSRCLRDRLVRGPQVGRDEMRATELSTSVWHIEKHYKWRVLNCGVIESVFTLESILDIPAKHTGAKADFLSPAIKHGYRCIDGRVYIAENYCDELVICRYFPSRRDILFWTPRTKYVPDWKRIKDLQVKGWRVGQSPKQR